MEKVQQPTVNIEQTVEKLQDMLRDSGWQSLLKSFMVSDDFHQTISTLAQQVSDGKRFTPPLKQVFRAFQECPVQDLKVVVIGQDPYPQIGVADGIAFSCGNTGKREASLRYIHKAICDTVYNGEKQVPDLSPDLTPWANQGVLMLNTSLTTEIGKIGRHFDLWKAFTAFTIDMLSNHAQPLVWVFLGKKAQEYAEMIDDKHIKLFASHPASAAYAHQQVWNCNDVFNQVNDHLTAMGKAPVVW